MKRRGPSSSTYGRACMGCFKCKCKCVVRPDGDGCERCHRLNKPCQPADAIRRRTIGTRKDPNARIAELQGKLDSLVSVLKSRKVLDADAEMLSLETAFEHSESGDNTDKASLSDDDGETVRPPRISISPSPVTNTRSKPSQFPPLMDHLSLDKFRSRMLHYFPFIHLPADVTMAQLERERPHLYSAILCVASASTPESSKRVEELRRVLYEATFVPRTHEDRQKGGNRTMDLLQSLLVYIAWGWDHVRNGISLSRLMMLAVSLVGEMHLHKPIPSDAHAFRLFNPGPQDFPVDETSNMSTQLVLEGHRALLGCFLLSCVISAYFGEVEALRWTPKMEEAILALETNEDCVTDAVLVLQVRLQRLAAEAAEVRSRPETDEAQDTKYIAGLLRELQELRPSIPDAGPTSVLPPTATISTRILMAHSHYIEIDTIGAMYEASPVFGHLPIDCLSYLRQSVFAIELCTAGLLALAPSDLIGISFIQWVQLTRCIVVLHHLTLLQDPGWDISAMRATVDLPVLLEHTIKKLEKTALEAGKQGRDNIFTRLAQSIQQFSSEIEGSKTQLEPGTRGGKSAEIVASVAPQRGYFRNPRFWLESYFDSAGYSWAGLRTTTP